MKSRAYAAYAKTRTDGSVCPELLINTTTRGSKSLVTRQIQAWEACEYM